MIVSLATDSSLGERIIDPIPACYGVAISSGGLLDWERSEGGSPRRRGARR